MWQGLKKLPIQLLCLREDSQKLGVGAAPTTRADFLHEVLLAKQGRRLSSLGAAGSLLHTHAVDAQGEAC